MLSVFQNLIQINSVFSPFFANFYKFSGLYFLFCISWGLYPRVLGFGLGVPRLCLPPSRAQPRGRVGHLRGVRHHQDVRGAWAGNRRNPRPFTRRAVSEESCTIYSAIFWDEIIFHFVKEISFYATWNKLGIHEELVMFGPHVPLFFRAFPQHRIFEN